MHPPTIVSTVQRRRPEAMAALHGGGSRPCLPLGALREREHPPVDARAEQAEWIAWRGRERAARPAQDRRRARWCVDDQDVQELAVWAMRLHQDRMVGTYSHGACLEDVVAIVVQLSVASARTPVVARHDVYESKFNAAWEFAQDESAEYEDENYGPEELSKAFDEIVNDEKALAP